MIVDKACFERGCACYDDRVDGPGVEVVEKTEKQEPVATVVSENEPVTMSWWHEPALPVGTKLYTTPPQREWVGLTLEEVQDSYNPDYQAQTRAIEAKLRSKNQ